MLLAPLQSEEFVGRREEIGFLTDVFRTACESRLRMVLVEGDAGVGKTRLLTEFLNSLTGIATVAVGTCSEQIRFPYLPFMKIVETLDPRAGVAALRPREPAVRDNDARWEYWSSVATLMRAQAAKRPLFIAIEDAQWIDDGSVDLLRFLIERLDGFRCVILITARGDALDRSACARALRSALARTRAATVQLRALRRHEIKHVVQALLARRGLHLEPATIAQIETLAEGNPLFAEELVQVALANNALSFQTRLPVTAQTILSERLASFSLADRRLLYIAALIGRTFDVPFLSVIAGRHEQEIRRVVERAAESELVREEGFERFAFRHALVRQVLADQLPVQLASPLHMRIAEQLEAKPGANDRAAELAYHYAAARVPQKARTWNEAAAEAAWGVHAYRDAIRFYTEALRFDYPAGPARAAVYERIGTLLYIEGVGEEPAQWFARAREEYERIGNAGDAARVLLLEADQRWVDARTPEAAALAATAAQAASALEHAQLHAESSLSLARYAITLGSVDRAFAHVRAVLPLRAHFDRSSEAAWREISGELYAIRGDAAAAMREFCAASRLAAESGISELISQIENNFALAAFDLGEIALAAQHHQSALDEAHRTSRAWRIAYCSLNYARTLMFKGELEHARALVWSALERGVTTATFKTKAASVGIPLALLCNDRAMLESCADETALDLAQRSGEIQRIASVSAAFASLRAAQGSTGEARALLRRNLRAISHAHRAWDLFIAVARWAASDDILFAGTLLERAAGRPVVKRAYRLLFQAFAAAKADRTRAERLGSLAARNFERMEDALHAAMALAIGRNEDRAEPLQELPLTQRQMQVAELVARGETNRSIASHLRISEHTVEHHLSSIFERLGLRSRAQLANMLGRRTSSAV